MARDRTYGSNGAVTTTSYDIPKGRGIAESAKSNTGTQALTDYLSSWNVRETTGAATALVKIRDSLALPGPMTAADGAAGNSTAGLHMYLITWVTAFGESTFGHNAGDRVEATTAGSKIVSLTAIPTWPVTGSGSSASPSGGGVPIIGRRVYATKAGAPATGVQPTRAQWFLTVADSAATLAAGMNNLALPSASITVNSTTGFQATNGNILVTTANGIQKVSYTSVDATHFLGCVGGTGYMSTGAAVTQPMIGDNTSTTFSLNVADASFTATNPPLADTAGEAVREIFLAANQDVGDENPNNVIGAQGDGGFAVEINSGTVVWKLGGQ